MFLSSLTCEKCPDFYFQIEKSLETNIIAKKKCNHFEVFLSANIKGKNIFDNCKLILECKNCHNILKETFTVPEEIFSYNCKCGYGSLQFYYAISDNMKIYYTPKGYKSVKNDDKIINLILIYENNNYNYVVHENDLLKDHYQEIRKKINFSDGKKIYMNNNELDQNKTFKENKIYYNNMKLEIEE